MTPAELRADPWAFGPWCWVVDQVRLLPAPIPCRGMQGLWPLPRELFDALRGIVDLAPDLTGCTSALTLLQPYASAVAVGPKRVENRPWRRRVPPGGMWVGLHAGKALVGPDDEVDAMLECWRHGPDALFPDDPHWPEAPELADLPRGVMLGAMHIAEILRYPEAR